MTMAQLRPGSAPRVELFKGDIAVWAGSGGADATGLVLSADAAFDTAIKMLVLAAGLRSGVVPTVSGSIEVEIATPIDEDRAARMIVNVEGAPFSIPFSATEFHEFAAGVSAVALEIG